MKTVKKELNQMKYKEIYKVFFSPSGTTKRISDRLFRNFEGGVTSMDLLLHHQTIEKCFERDEFVVVCLPVFSGRIPVVCEASLKKLKGENTPLVAIAVYGNRHYDAAVLEINDLLTKNGFIVIGAGAFPAQHSIFPKTATGRPDSRDFEKIDEFSKLCIEKLLQLESNCDKCNTEESINLELPGTRPYKERGTMPYKPIVKENCNFCGECARVCPVGAINPFSPSITQNERCISCTACIAACPVGARSFAGEDYEKSAADFEQRCAKRREPEWWL